MNNHPTTSVKRARLRAKITQEQAARALSISQSAYQRLEITPSRISQSRREALASLYGVTEQELMGFNCKFDILGANPDVQDKENVYFGRIIIRFKSGNQFLSLPVSYAEAASISMWVRNSFFCINTLANQSLIINTSTVAELNLIKFDNVTINHYYVGNLVSDEDNLQKPGVHPYDEFWEIIEFMANGLSIDEPPEHEYLEEIKQTFNPELVEIAMSELFLWDGSKKEKEKNLKAFFDCATDFSHRLTNGLVVSDYIADDAELFSGHASLAKALIEQDESLPFITYDKGSKTIIYNPSCIEFIAFPKHRLARAGLTISMAD